MLNLLNLQEHKLTRKRECAQIETHKRKWRRSASVLPLLKIVSRQCGWLEVDICSSLVDIWLFVRIFFPLRFGVFQKAVYLL